MAAVTGLLLPLKIICPHCSLEHEIDVAVRLRDSNKLLECDDTWDEHGLNKLSGCGKLFVVKYRFGAVLNETFKVESPERTAPS